MREEQQQLGQERQKPTHLLLHSKQLHDVLVVEFLQNLKLSHLDIERPQEAQVVEHLDGVQVTCFLPQNQNLTLLDRQHRWITQRSSSVSLTVPPRDTSRPSQSCPSDPASASPSCHPQLGLLSPPCLTSIFTPLPWFSLTLVSTCPHLSYLQMVPDTESGVSLSHGFGSFPESCDLSVQVRLPVLPTL